MAFLTYQDTRPWAKAIKTAVLTKKMPPWFADPNYGHFSEESARKLSQTDIETIKTWVDNGAPEGDPNDKARPREFSAGGWSIKPDIVFAMPKAYPIPAKGTIEYTEIVIPTGFAKDTWVSAAEILPGDRGYVHHMQAYIRPPGSTWLKEAKPGEFYVPTVYRRDANGFPTDVLKSGQQDQRGGGSYQPLLAACGLRARHRTAELRTERLGVAHSGGFRSRAGGALYDQWQSRQRS